MIPTLLIVDDEAVAREGLSMALEDQGYSLVQAETAPAALSILESETVDLILTDLRMPGMDGLELLSAVQERQPHVPVIVITGFATVDTAISAMKHGAFDYLTKPYNIDKVRLTVKRALTQQQLRQENLALRQELARLRGSGEILGKSRAMKAVLELVAQVAPSRSSVLITGESGTGKELVARALHRMGPRSSSSFVSLNCGALSETLLENELFGHEKGAYTDARERKAGLIESADGGTIFLDEIAEVSAAMQAKLLRVLQEREILRIGGTRPVKVDFRLVAATNRDLDEEMDQGRFRRDLFYRLNVIRVVLPPLRERLEDIPLLAEHFREKFAKEEGKDVERVTKEALEALGSHSWPGNVRELENVVQRAIILDRDGVLGRDDLPPEVTTLSAHEVQDLPSLREQEKRYILYVLDRVGQNRTQAARVLGLDRSSLWRKLKEYDTDK